MDGAFGVWRVILEKGGGVFLERGERAFRKCGREILKRSKGGLLQQK